MHTEREERSVAQERDFEPGSALPPYRVWLCGTFRVEQLRSDTYTFVSPTQWGGSNYPRLLFKALLCCPERRENRKTLLDMLWSEIDSEQATAHFNTATTKLRRFLRPANAPGSLLITEAATSYALAAQEILWVDTDAALTLLKEAEQQGRTTRGSLSLLEQAATYLNRGSFLEGEEGHWLSKQRKRVAEARYRCRLWLAEAYEQQSLPGQAECIQWFEQQHLCLSPATIGLAEQIRNGQREEEI
jgi:DNA-binding SARP family transcriptional activator